MAASLKAIPANPEAKKCNWLVIVMSITMNLYYTGKNGNAQKFVKEIEETGTADAIRNEEGNLRYEYFISMSEPETVLLIDSWKNQQALDIHHASEMMGKIAELREKYNLTMRAERFASDESGMLEHDRKFIREKEEN